MNIMPYRDEKDKRQAFIYGSAIGGLVGFGIASFLLAAGGVFLFPVAPSFPAVQTTPAVAAPVQPVVQATTSAAEETTHPKSTETVVAQGANYQDGRIAFIGGTDVPIQSNENGTH